MKKQFQILAGAFISIAIVSCTKQGVEIPGSAQKNTEEISTSSSSIANRGNNIDPLAVNLDGWFAFNGNLKDQTQQLPNGISTGRGAMYTTDRKGTAKAAITFNGSYGINLFKVPQQTHGSVSVWVKYYNANAGTGRMILKPKSTGLGIDKFKAELGGSVDLLPNYSLGINVDNVDKNWHHFVVTFDDDILRLYVDGQLVKSSPSTVTYPLVLEDYFVGYKNNEWFEGAIDELRFYSRTLSASDIQKLYNQ